MTADKSVHSLMPDTGSPGSPVSGHPSPRSVGWSGSSHQRALKLTPPEFAPSSFTLATTDASSASTPPALNITEEEYVPGANPRPVLQLPLPSGLCTPLPPMCMFFSPTFHDLKRGKVGVWEGHLKIKGRGGGIFSVLIVGEEATEYLWWAKELVRPGLLLNLLLRCHQLTRASRQSHTWPSTVTYPPFPTSIEGYTATMMPVSHIMREGFTPVAMGMVLCSDSNISQYVAMVQGLHAEGVVRPLTVVA